MKWTCQARHERSDDDGVAFRGVIFTCIRQHPRQHLDDLHYAPARGFWRLPDTGRGVLNTEPIKRSLRTGVIYLKKDGPGAPILPHPRPRRRRDIRWMKAAGVDTWAQYMGTQKNGPEV